MTQSRKWFINAETAESLQEWCEVSQRDHGRVRSLLSSNSRLLTLCLFARMCCVSFYVFHFTCSILHPKFLTDLPLNPQYLHSACNSCRVSIHCTSHGRRRSWLLASRADLAMTLKPKLALVLLQRLFLQSWRAHLHHTKKCYGQTFKPPPDELVH